MRALVAFSLALMLVPGIALGAGSEDRYEVAGFSDADAFDEFFDSFREAVAADDPAAVAELVQFPITVNRQTDGGKPKTETIKGPKTLARKWARVFTPAVKAALAAQDKAGLFVNSQGVMVGDGALWFQATEDDETPALVMNVP